MIGLLGKKVGMTRLFGDNGESYASTCLLYTSDAADE